MADEVDKREAEKALKKAQERRPFIERLVSSVWTIQEDNHLIPRISSVFKS